MHLRDPKNNYLTGMRDTATACCVLRDDFREALINSKIFRFAVGFCAYGSLRDAFQCIAQPNTTLLDCILYLMQHPYDPGTLPSSAN